MFRVLPFGLSTACYVFTKLLRPLVRRWRALGLKAIVYIDDGICASDSAVECSKHRDIILSDLDNAGFILNSEKSHLVPSQVGPWLGFIIDLNKGLFTVPPEKIAKLKAAIANVLPFGRNSVCAIASIIGQIISMSLALGPVTRLRTRAMYTIINQRLSWYDKVFLSDDAREELVFWSNTISQFNGKSIWFSPGATRVAFSDASSTGFGGYIVECGNEVSQGLRAPHEVSLSST